MITRPDKGNPQPSSLADEQALKWMLHLQFEDGTTEKREDFESWLEEHPDHRQEFDRYVEVWNGLDTIHPRLTRELEEAREYWNSQPSASKAARVKRLRDWVFRPVALGAVAAALVMTVWWWPVAETAPIQYRTAIGEQQTIALDDGSTVMLNTDTTLTVQLSEQERIVELERGEAWFQVTHDVTRPFQVEAGNGVIEDIGTQFIVKKSHQKVDVSVLEGMVKVGLRDRDVATFTAGPHILHEGNQVWYTAQGHLSSIQSFDALTVDAWREGKLIFDARPLGEVLEELARYTTGEIQLADPTLAELPVSGIFNIQDLGSFPQALQEAFPIKATQVNARLVVLERRAQS